MPYITLEVVMATARQKREYCKDPDHRKDYRITFRLSAADYQTLLGISKDEEKLISEVLREWVRSKVNEATGNEVGRSMAVV